MTDVSRERRKWSSEDVLDLLARRDLVDVRPVMTRLTREISVFELCKAMKNSSDLELKVLVVDMLGHKGARSAAPVLSDLLGSVDEDIRYAAADAIGKIYMTRPARRPRWQRQIGRALVEAHEAATDDGERAMMLSALGAVKYRPSTALLMKNLDSENEDVRQAARWAIQEMDVSSSVPAGTEFIEGASVIGAVESFGSTQTHGSLEIPLNPEVMASLTQALTPNPEVMASLTHNPEVMASLTQALTEVSRSSLVAAANLFDKNLASDFQAALASLTDLETLAEASSHLFRDDNLEQTLSRLRLQGGGLTANLEGGVRELRRQVQEVIEPSNEPQSLSHARLMEFFLLYASLLRTLVRDHEFQERADAFLTAFLIWTDLDPRTVG